MTLSPHQEAQATTAIADQVVEDVGDWIDQYTIARLVADTIRDEFSIDPTVEQCQAVWYRVLEQLHDLIDSCAAHLYVDYD